MSISSSKRRIFNGTTHEALTKIGMSTDVSGARSCREAREQSRKEMHFLNEKLASQIEKIRQLSEQNKKLLEETNGSRERIRETEKIRQTYNTELRQLRQLVDDCEREKAESLAKMATLNQTIRSKQDQIQQMAQSNQNLSDQLDQALKDLAIKEADNALLQRHVKAAEEEANRLRAALEKSKQNNQQLHTSLDEETASRMTCQSEMQTLREEMEFLRTVHEQELDELRALANVDHEQDRAQWREEMQRAIRDIQAEYDQRLDKIRNEMETNYASRMADLNKANSTNSIKMQELLNENTSLKNNLEGMRKRAEQFRIKYEKLEDALNGAHEDCHNMQQRLENSLRDAEKDRQTAEDALNKAIAELNALADAKLNLESEIAAYRRLLEAQEFLFSNSMDSVNTRKDSIRQSPKELRVRVPVYTNTQTAVRSTKSDSFSRWTDREEPSGQSSRLPVAERTVEGSQQLSCSYSDSEKLNVSQTENYHRGQLVLSDCSPNGHYIEITNTGNNEARLVGWCLIRNIDSGRQITRFTLPASTVPPFTSFRIWSAGKMGPEAGQYDFEAPYPNWGTGGVVTTSLYSPDGTERATHTQRLEFSP